MIPPGAEVDPGARLDERVRVGAWTRIGAEVEIGAGTSIGDHVVLGGPTRIGRDNTSRDFCWIGGDPAGSKFTGGRALREIGAGNVIREFCTFNRGTAGGGGVTRIGSRNWVMAYVHIAHDCRVADDVVMANATTLAGHVHIDEFATCGAFTTVHQFCAIGAHAFTGMGTVVLQDVPPYVIASGNPARPHGINAEGLRRHGFDRDTMRALRDAYKQIYLRDLRLEVALGTLDQSTAQCPSLGRLVEFIRGSQRGIVR